MNLVRILALFCFLIATIRSDAQKGAVERNEVGIQVGNQGIWVHYERALSDDFVIRTEIGLDVDVVENTIFYRGGPQVVPVIRLEPRWYYNLNNRADAGKSTAGNAASFVALQTSWRPGPYLGSESRFAYSAERLSIAPMWGVRTLLSDRWTFEGGIGIEYFQDTERQYTPLGAGQWISSGDKFLDTGFNPYWHLRVGYRF